ncbi:hypothetical protein ElyMa_006671800 [Elysia marginata]|uniref:Uncharacterized protein n=1 Tax=Elysia marginata TaxID=1093978 RepID=A0AAV4IPW3_9GAST|nr:hypothetical protein ElyMa_006671800 [Elysia marginata]
MTSCALKQSRESIRPSSVQIPGDATSTVFLSTPSPGLPQIPGDATSTIFLSTPSPGSPQIPGDATSTFFWIRNSDLKLSWFHITDVLRHGMIGSETVI